MAVGDTVTVAVATTTPIARATGADAAKCASEVGVPAHVCVHCGLSFPSRNALFRHLKEQCDPSAAKVVDEKERIVLVVGYLGSRYFGVIQGREEHVRPTVEGAIIDSLRCAWGDAVVVSGITRCTKTEKGVHAAENVFLLTIQKPGFVAGNSRRPSLCETALRYELEKCDIWLTASPKTLTPSITFFEKIYDAKKRVYRVYVPYFALMQRTDLENAQNDGIWLGHLQDKTSILDVVALIFECCGVVIAESDVAIAEGGSHAFVKLAAAIISTSICRINSFTWRGKLLHALPAQEARIKIAVQKRIRKVLKALRGQAKVLRDFHNFILDAEPQTQTSMKSLQHCSAGGVGEEVRRALPHSSEVSSSERSWSDEDWTRITFSAREFGTQQVRRMMGAVVAVSRGVEDLEYIDRCFRAETVTVLPVPAEAVCLESMQFGQWNADWRGAVDVDPAAMSAGLHRIQARVVSEAMSPWRNFLARLDAPGATRMEMQKDLAEAAALGDLDRVNKALSAGAPLEAVDEYGQSALFLAACSGQSEVVRLLAAARADVNCRANGGSTPCVSAAAAGHVETLEALIKAGADNKVAGSEGKTPEAYLAERASAGVGTGSYCQPLENKVQREGVVTNVLIPDESEHPGAGTVTVDGALSDAVLRRLEELWQRLPLAPKTKASPTERAYFADTEGWLTRQLSLAVAAAGLPHAAGVMPHMRFLIYPEPGGSLPAHVDLARVDPASGRRSTHTFLLYLSDCHEGGETVFLESLPGDAALAASGGVAPGPREEVASCVPRRGRLLLMPHACPHLAAPVMQVPKVLVRGEVLPLGACSESSAPSEKR